MEEITREMRISGIEAIGDNIIEAIFSEIRPILVEIIDESEGNEYHEQRAVRSRIDC